MSSLAFEVRELPDLTLAKYQSLADSGVSGVLLKHGVFLRQWHGICAELGISIHLLYAFDAKAQKGYRLRIFFILQGSSASLESARPLVNNSPLSQFYAFDEASIPDMSFLAGATLAKVERVDSVFNPLSGKSKNVHHVPSWEVSEDSRLIELVKMMQTIGAAYDNAEQTGGRCAFRVDLYASQEAERTRSIFDPLLRSLKGDFDIKLTEDSHGAKKDSHVSDICRVFEDWLTVVETTPHFRMNVYSFADRQFQAKLLLNAASSEVIEKGNCLIAPIRSDRDESFRCTSRMGIEASSYCVHASSALLADWPTTFSLEEAASFFRFPVLYDGESIELPKETAPPKQDQGILFGHDANGYDVFFPLDMLPRHAFFTGMPGSGKTNTMLHLATTLHGIGIPFLVLEPAKKEYRSLLSLPEMDDVFLFSPHVQSYFPLQVNPLEFPVGVRLSEHISALLEVFQGSFSLEGPAFKFLSSAIQTAYEGKGWAIEDINDENMPLPFPTLRDVYENIEKEVELSSYDSEIKGNVRSFIQVRLGGLMERDAGELFDAPFSTIHPGEWLLTSAIVELEVLSEQAKNFFILLVCQYISETLRAKPSASPEMPVRHAIFIEEAHNIIASDSRQMSSDTVDPKVSSTAYIVKMLAEVRALREAIVISDQLPTTLATEVTKNTGLKLVHRLASQDDREAIGSSISATPAQIEAMNDLPTGSAFIHYEGVKKPFPIQVKKWKGSPQDCDITIDEELAAHVQNSEPLHRARRIDVRNWVEKCMSSLSPKVSEFLTRQNLAKGDSHMTISLLEEKNALLGEIDQKRRSFLKKRELRMPGDETLDKEIAQTSDMLEGLEGNLTKY